MKEYRKIQRIHKTLYVCVPASLKEGFAKGEYVSIEVLNNRMIVESVNPSGKTDLQTHHTQPIKEGEAK